METIDKLDTVAKAAHATHRVLQAQNLQEPFAHWDELTDERKDEVRNSVLEEIVCTIDPMVHPTWEQSLTHELVKALNVTLEPTEVDA